MFYLVKYSTFGIREIVIPKTVETITSRLYSFYTGSNEIIPEIPLKILCEKESKIDSYSIVIMMIHIIFIQKINLALKVSFGII